jgi:tetratricopeptide (TPR) repeat protein
MNNLGNVQLSLGNYEQAIPFFKESIALNIELENRFGLVESFVSIGQCVARIRANKASATLH